MYSNTFEGRYTALAETTRRAYLVGTIGAEPPYYLPTSAQG